MQGDIKMELTKPKKRKNKKNKKIKITFDEDFASNQDVLKLIDSCKNAQLNNQNKTPETKQVDNNDGTTPINNQESVSQNHTGNPPTKKKRKRNQKAENTTDEVKGESEEAAVDDSQFELNPAKPQIEGEESIRQRKKKRYLQLIEDKKLKSEVKLQESCLNYLSQWKHSRSTWKFEKLKQIWILQHMYDNTRIPDEVWMTVVEYFSKAMGKIKSTIMSEALKIVESNSNKDEEEEVDVKCNRARYIVQNLQE